MVWFFLENRALEHFHQSCSVRLRPLRGNGVFNFWLRFGPATGRCGHASRSKISPKDQKSQFRIATSFLSML